MKFRPAWTMGAVVVLACLSVLAVRYIDRIPPQRLASLMGITVTVSDLKATPSQSPRVTPAGGDQSAILGAVAVQTFDGPNLIRQGHGTVVSADGLLLTTVSAAPYGSGSFVYQVATPRGQLLRAHRVAADRSSGLTLLKTDATDLDAVLFDAATQLFSGQQLEAVGAHILVSSFTSQRLPLWVTWVGPDSQITLSLDRSFGPAFHGARVVDSSNRSVGMLRYSSGPSLISATVINAFLESYLNKQVKK